MFWTAEPFRSGVSVDRRRFLATTGSLAAAAIWSTRAEGFVQRNVAVSDYPFRLGVASGDPGPDGFVIWTRLAPRPIEGGGMPDATVEVDWQVAEDEQMTKLVRSGTTTAVPNWAHAVHVEVDGLRPDRWYWYRFRAAGDLSPVGRARTFPAAGTVPAAMRFAFASCQNYEDGLFTAYEHMAREELDFIAHLGDYIYEGKARTDRVRRHQGNELDSLEDYRNRYALYRTDELLQAAHRLFPWIVTPDDHEVDNDYANSISEEANVTPEMLLARRARAYQAYYEHMPLRRTSLPTGPDLPIYRRLAYGRLAEFFVLDTRQFRSDQPCGSGNKPQCPEALDPDRSVLGAGQREWLFDGLAKSTGKWNVLAQQIMIARVNRGAGDQIAYSMDQWPGYEMDRRRVLKAILERKVSNPVTIAGDIHSNWANDLIADFDELDSRVVASEFVGTSISSGGDGEAPRTLDQMLSKNPFVKFHNTERGYVSCRVTPTQWQSDYRTVPYVTRPGAPIVTRASFVVEDGKPGVKKI